VDVTVDDPQSDIDMLTFRADLGDARHRLDRALLRHAHEVSGLSRARVQKWITGGLVTVNHVRVLRPGVSVPSSAHISVALPPSAHRRQRPEPEPGPLDIVYEDDHLLVVNKPAGMVVHPSYRNATGTMLNHVLWHVRRRSAPVSPGLVSRLDKGTSGLVGIALTHGAHASAQRAAAAGPVRKEYLALVAGTPTPPSGRIALPLRRDSDDRRRMVVADDGVHCETWYTTTATGATTSLLTCVLVTGRTHQIRVHLAATSCPILGDPVYGVALDGLTRPALHASRVTLPHPSSGETMHLEAPLPTDLRRVALALDLEPRHDPVAVQ